MSTVARTKSPPSRVGAFAVVILIFVGLGPIVGSLSVWVFLSAGRLFNMGIGHSDPIGYFSMLAAILFFGYIIGIVYALIAGLVVAAAGIFLRWNDVLVPVGAALMASVIGAYIPWLYSKLLSGQMEWAGILPVCIVATLVCWFVTRGIVRATWPNAN